MAVKKNIEVKTDFFKYFHSAGSTRKRTEKSATYNAATEKAKSKDSKEETWNANAKKSRFKINLCLFVSLFIGLTCYLKCDHI